LTTKKSSNVKVGVDDNSRSIYAPPTVAYMNNPAVNINDNNINIYKNANNCDEVVDFEMYANNINNEDVEVMNDVSKNYKVVKRMLIVDDAPTNRKMLVRTLIDKVDVIHEACDGLVAVEKVRESIANNQPFDVILMDFMMPNMNGPDATRVIRGMGNNSIILGVTGNVGGEDMTHFISRGADGVLPKPFDLTAMCALLAGNYCNNLYNIFTSFLYNHNGLLSLFLFLLLYREYV
jgi:CheY-like chemotaxis protein